MFEEILLSGEMTITGPAVAVMQRPLMHLEAFQFREFTMARIANVSVTRNGMILKGCLVGEEFLAMTAIAMLSDELMVVES